MHRLLRDLLEDLAHRCDAVRERLLRLNVPEAANGLALLAARSVVAVRRDIGTLLADSALDNPVLAPDHLRLFRRMAERVQLAEYYALPSLERFNQHDIELSALAARIISESSLQLVPPVVTASSSTYYWTQPTFYIISVPAGEPGSLLGLSDLVHEFGHLVRLTAPILPIRVLTTVNDAFQTARTQSLSDGTPHAQNLMAAGRLWEDVWLEEFVCDVLATYVLGASFGYQHVRLCALLGGRLFEPELGQRSTHPAHAARMRIILAALNAYGAVEDAAAVQALWDRFAAHQLGTRSSSYHLCYPDDLLEFVATEVVQACRTIGITDSLTTRARTGTVTEILLAAWERFLADSSSFGSWEEATLAAVYATP